MVQDTHTFAVLTRGMYDESPFLAEFVGYYLSLGFDQVYFINTDTQIGYVNQCLPPILSARVTVIDMPNVGEDWQELVLNEAIRWISEEWVLVVDLDEFLVLHGQSIQAHVHRYGVGYSKFRFRWLLALSTNYFETSVFDLIDGPLYVSNTGKIMARRTSIDQLSLHDASITSGHAVECTFDYAVDPFILHVSCRGFLDLISRIVGRNYGNDKTGRDQVDRLKRFLKSSDERLDQYPFRFHLYRIQLTSADTTIRVNRINSMITTGIHEGRALAVWSSKLTTIGLSIDETTVSGLEIAIEAMCNLRARLFYTMPDKRFIRMHLEEGKSYVNATRAYVHSLAPENVCAASHDNALRRP